MKAAYCRLIPEPPAWVPGGVEQPVEVDLACSWITGEELHGRANCEVARLSWVEFEPLIAKDLGLTRFR